MAVGRGGRRVGRRFGDPNLRCRQSAAAGEAARHADRRPEGTYPPFSFRGEDGKLTGFEVDFANALAEHGRESQAEPDQVGRHAGFAGFEAHRRGHQR